MLTTDPLSTRTSAQEIVDDVVRDPEPLLVSSDPVEWEMLAREDAAVRSLIRGTGPGCERALRTWQYFGRPR